MPAPSAFPSPDLSPAVSVGRWFSRLRRSGFLAHVPSPEWHALSALLAFLGPDGRATFALEHVALALGLSTGEAAERLKELTRSPWQGQPLASLAYGPGGEVTGAELSALELFTGSLLPNGAASAGPESAGPEGEAIPLPPPQPPGQEAATGAVTGGASGDALQEALFDAGLFSDQVDRLLSEYPAERVRRQLEWLPARKARVPAALLVRAIEGDWGPPKEAEDKPDGK